METPGLKVLLIEPDKNQNVFFSEILMDLGFRVITAKNVDSAIQKLLCHSPRLIICQKELNDDSGFLLFSMLRNNLSDHQTPFILLLNVFDKKDLSLGVEMGIDSFLFPPFEREKMAHILQNQLEKSNLGKANTFKQFKLFFEATPFGIFFCRNEKIVETNRLFNELVRLGNSSKLNTLITDIFDFGTDSSNEFKLLRCLNGITKYSSFRDIPLQSDTTARFNLFLNFVENDGASIKIAGLLISANDIYEQQFDLGNFKPLMEYHDKMKTSENKPSGNNDFFTNREIQVLKLSAEGAPIKQIAGQLGISLRTVEKHRSNIFRKTNSGNIIEAVNYAQKKHLLEMN
ncbi:MAG TPA: response regulator [Mariniphaga anaerophila]|uniref:Response regulator n=1 Tax=Mariniphaga anaerophila TaxID=1484053 RepID=A0A831LV31_9BACT|nr:response regulator [Mariniphaga anaerophila]